MATGTKHRPLSNPISVGEGGSGTDSVFSTTTVNDIVKATKDSNNVWVSDFNSNIKVVNASYKQWGKVAQISITFQAITNSIPQSTQTGLAELVDNKKPAGVTGGIMRVLNLINAYIPASGTNAGVCTMNSTVDIATNVLLRFDSTYLLP